MHPSAALPTPIDTPRGRDRLGWLAHGVRRAAASCRRWLARVIDGRSADRRLLEDVILAHYADQAVPIAVLSVGVHRASRGYESLFDGHRYVTLDRDPAVRAYGSSHHVVGGVDDLPDALSTQRFDLIVLNGVIGWGLDEADLADRALRHLHRLLRPGGELVIGWNDRPGRRPFGPVSPDTLPALRLFHRSLFRPLRASSVHVGGWRRHRYDFFRKPCGDAATRPVVRRA